MGRLINLSHIGEGDGHKYSKHWFFPTEDIEVETVYPHQLAIHQDLVLARYPEEAVREAGMRRIEIRKFIERSLEGDVIYQWKRMSYIRVFPPNESNGKRYKTEITHGYYVFHFETNQDAFHFKMKFGEWVSTVNIRHPKYPEGDGSDDLFGKDALWRARDLGAVN